MNTLEKLDALRARMTACGLSALIVPSGDPHQSEYVADHWQARAWLTGFTGSAGTAVVTRDKALLWTDFRYWIQAESQMDAFELVKQGEADVPSFNQWLIESLALGERIGVDGRMVSASEAGKWKAGFEEMGLSLDTEGDLISPLWQDRPSMPATKAFVLSDRFAGQPRNEKLAAVRSKLAAHKAPVHLMATLDDIAWTFNLRGADVHTNPVNLAYALITPDTARLFINPDKLDPEVTASLEADGILLEPYEKVEDALKQIPDNTRVCLDPDRVSIHLYEAVNPRAKIVDKPNPAVALKAIKNRVEIQWLEKTAVKDGRAVVNFLHWLAHETGAVTEISAAGKMHEFRAAQEDFFDDSFSAIMASADHSAMCHYSATQETDLAVTDRGMFLTDSGGNYLTGTTDITRTVHLGRPTNEERRDYTLVLKGHIAVALSRFPRGTRGYQIDTLSRQFLWQQGMDFGHGTGHGVGFFLCVHEGPARISPHPVDETLKPGMLLTNEPGIYREGSYGIRLENMVLVTEDRKTEFGQFLKFKNLTLCHFERNLIDAGLLTAEERGWVDDYHARVYEALAPGLDADVAEWLKEKTRPL